MPREHYHTLERSLLEHEEDMRMRLVSRHLYYSDFLSLLGNSRRRRIITALHEVGGKACVREIVRRVAEMEKGVPSDWRSRKSVYTGIIQNHLPKMRRAGLVEYDREKDVICLLPKGNHYLTVMIMVETSLSVDENGQPINLITIKGKSSEEVLVKANIPNEAG